MRKIKFLIYFVFAWLFVFQSLVAQTNCNTPDYITCTQPIMPTLICPEFCGEGSFEIVSAHPLFDCSVVLMGDCFQYTALPAFIALDEIDIIACNEIGICDSSKAYINVTENMIECDEPLPCLVDAPTVCTIEESITFCPEFCFTDDNYSLFVFDENNNINGSLIIDNHCIVYQAANGFEGVETIGIAACHNLGMCDTTYANVTVGDCSPQPSEAEMCTPIFMPINICANLATGEMLDLGQSESVFHCNITPSVDDCLVYQPFPGFEGTDFVTLTICEIANPTICREEEYTVHVGCVWPSANEDILTLTPEIVNFNGQSTPNTTAFDDIIIDLTLNDDMMCSSDLNINILNLPSNGFCQIVNDKEVRYRPFPNFNGSDAIVYQVCNNCNLCSSASVLLNISGNTISAVSPNLTAENKLNFEYIKQQGDFLELAFKSPKSTATLSLYTQNGQILHQKKFETTGNQMQHYRLPLGFSANNFYLLNLETEKQRVTEKVIVLK
ncbi:MAG: Ig-like domain-containing protein [Chitinophagales bacterium]